MRRKIKHKAPKSLLTCSVGLQKRSLTEAEVATSADVVARMSDGHITQFASVGLLVAQIVISWAFTIFI